ncbi:hypothetical protein B0H12DRAFT_958740, partial [Mycena haematopus]
IVLLRGDVSEFTVYSRTERTAWLHDIAHDICDPIHKTGTLWFQDPLTAVWTQASATENLRSGIYEYRPPPGVNFSLSKYSHRNNKSFTSAGGAAADMRRNVVARDRRCWISGADGRPVTNSHICPKRMGDAMAGHIYHTFCGGAAANISVYNEMFGLLLVKNLDAYFDFYELGFRQPPVYEAHHFALNVQTITITGVTYPNVPLLHGHHVQPPRPLAPNLPPPGLFRWHYMQ